MGWGGKDKKMRNKYFRFASCMLPMNLQFFAEPGDGAGADGGNGGGAEGGEGGTSGDDGTEPPSFDDLLKNGHQAEFDRRVQKAIETAVGKAQEKWQALTDDKLSEAEKLNRMTKEEKAQYLAQKREEKLAEREAGITRRELMADAKNTLAEKKLPVGLAEVLNYTDEDSCKKSIAIVEKAFHEILETAVYERLKGSTPPTKAPETKAITKDEYSKMGYAERLKLKTDDPELYRQLSRK